MSALPVVKSRPRLLSRWLGGGRWQAAILILTAIIGFISWSPRLGDFAGYLQVGRAVLDGADIYRDTPPGINTWPPFFSLICVPLALIARLSTYLATSLWLLLNFAVLLVVLDLLARILYGERLTLRRHGPGLSITSTELFVPLILTSTYLFNNFEHTQINLILLGLTLGGLYLLDTARVPGGALALGLAISMKVMPVVFLPYLAFTRSWRALLKSTAVTAVLSLSPILLFGWTRYWDYVASWRRVIGQGWGVGAYNQSIYAMWDRLIVYHVHLFAPGTSYNLERSGNPAVGVAFALTLLAIGLLTLRQFRIGPRNHPWVVATEWSVMLIISTMWGPVLWKLYLVVLLVPNTLLFAVWRRPGIDRRSRRIVGSVLFSSAFMALLTGHDLVGNDLAAKLELGSIATLSALVVLGGLLWLRGRPDLLTGSAAAPASEAS
jgi:hypothetical protein